MIYEKCSKFFNKYIKRIAFILLCFSFFLTQFSSLTYASSVPDNYIFANFYDYFIRDTNQVRNVIQHRLEDTDYPGYSITKNTYDTIMNNSQNYSKMYYYIKEKTSSDSAYTIYLYTYAGAENSGTMNYYNIANFVCYTKITYVARLSVPASPNTGTVQLHNSVGTFSMPVVFYGQPFMYLFTTDKEDKEIASSIKEQTTAIQEGLNETNNNLNEIDSSIDNATNELSDMNDYIQDEDISNTTVDLATNEGLDNDNVNGFFSRLVNIVSNMFNYSDDTSRGYTIELAGHSTMIFSSSTREILNDLKCGWLIPIVNGMWCFFIGYFIYNDIRKIVDSFTDFSFMDKTIDADLL